jgi:hypothetical protein
MSTEKLQEERRGCFAEFVAEETKTKREKEGRRRKGDEGKNCQREVKNVLLTKDTCGNL